MGDIVEVRTTATINDGEGNVAAALVDDVDCPVAVRLVVRTSKREVVWRFSRALLAGALEFPGVEMGSGDVLVRRSGKSVLVTLVGSLPGANESRVAATLSLPASAVSMFLIQSAGVMSETERDASLSARLDRWLEAGV